MDRNVLAARFEIFPNTRFTSRDTTAIDNSRLVTGLVTVSGNIYPDMGQVLPGLRLLDGRYLFAGLLANLFRNYLHLLQRCNLWRYRAISRRCNDCERMVYSWRLHEKRVIEFNYC